MKGELMGNYKATLLDNEIRLWCHYKGIYATPVQAEYGKRSWKIELSINGKKSISPESFSHINLWSKVFEYRKFYYLKQNKK